MLKRSQEERQGAQAGDSTTAPLLSPQLPTFWPVKCHRSTAESFSSGTRQCQPSTIRNRVCFCYSVCVTLKEEGAPMQVRLNWTKFHLPHKTSGTTGAHAAKKREELLLLPSPLLLSTRAQQSSKRRALPRAAEPQAASPQWVPQHSRTVTSL